MDEEVINYAHIKDPKKRAMIHALEMSLGVVQTASAKVGMHRSTHYDWCDKDSERYDADYKREVESLKNVCLDFVESQLFSKIQGTKMVMPDGKTVYKKEPDGACIIFYLKTVR